MTDDITDRVRAERDKSSRGLPWGLADELLAEVQKLRTALCDVAIDQYLREKGMTL